MFSFRISSSSSSDFWSNRGYRKRKFDNNDFEDKLEKNKIFVTEDMLIKNMQTLSLDLSDTQYNQYEIFISFIHNFYYFH